MGVRRRSPGRSTVFLSYIFLFEEDGTQSELHSEHNKTIRFPSSDHSSCILQMNAISCIVCSVHAELFLPEKSRIVKK